VLYCFQSMLLCFGYYAIISLKNRKSLFQLLCVIFVSLIFHRLFFSSVSFAMYHPDKFLILFFIYFIVVTVYSFISYYVISVSYTSVSVTYRKGRLIFFLSLSLSNRFLLCCYWFISETVSKASPSSSDVSSSTTSSYFYSRAVVVLSLFTVICSLIFHSMGMYDDHSTEKFKKLFIFWNLSILFELFVGFKNSLLVLILLSLMTMMLSMLKVYFADVERHRGLSINFLLAICLCFWERLLYFLTSHAMTFSSLQVNWY
jgi:hypothetical protein